MFKIEVLFNANLLQIYVEYIFKIHSLQHMKFEKQSEENITK